MASDGAGDGDGARAETCSVTTTPSPEPRPPPMAFTSVRDLEFKVVDGASLTLDLFTPTAAPAGGTAYPVIVGIHGGGFVAGDKRSLADWAPELTSKGFALALVNYRLSANTDTGAAPDNVFPAAVVDIKAAIRWLRAHAAHYKLDASRFGALGPSAGGGLAAFIGVSGDEAEYDVGDNLEQSSAVRAVVDMFGPVNFTTVNADRVAQGVAAQNDDLSYTGCKPPCENAVKASPISHISANDAAFFLLHGTADPVVPMKQSGDFYTALKAGGVSVSYAQVKGAGHGDGPAPQAGVETFVSYRPRASEFFTCVLK